MTSMTTTTSLAVRATPALPQVVLHDSAPQSFLSFRLGAEEYALPLLAVQEIRSGETPTRTPDARGAYLGVVRLREDILPVLDLRLFLNLPVPADDGQAVFIVLRNHANGLALRVDAVSDVLHLGADELKPMPAMAASTLDGKGELMQAIASSGDRMLIVLDAPALLASLALN